jgi:hypothetical protein
MTQLSLTLDLGEKGRNGAVWWSGNWECRNWHGYFQSREGGVGNWCFHIPWFSNDDVTCTVYGLNDAGEIYNKERIPIDAQANITILGKKYGREYWDH